MVQIMPVKTYWNILFEISFRKIEVIRIVLLDVLILFKKFMTYIDTCGGVRPNKI
jgi:hypothetical protein